LLQVLIVDDIPVLREHAAKVLQEALNCEITVTEVGTGADALSTFKDLKPDLIILDLALPDTSGINVAGEIWKQKPDQKILFWSQFHRESYVRGIGKILPDEAIHGYALKTRSDDNLAYAIQAIMLHDLSYIDTAVRSVRLNMRTGTEALSDIEHEALLDIAVGLTDKAIGKRRFISARAVQKRVSSLIEKLLHDETESLKQATGMEILNPRTRLLCVAFSRGLLTTEELDESQRKMYMWLQKEFHKDRGAKAASEQAPPDED
jgi:DNA-binding NarL/FixJ family response regulator